MKFIDKYLIFVALGLFLLCLLLTISNQPFYLSYLFFWIGIVLIVAYKRKSIKHFFITKNIKLLDKYLISITYLLLIIMFTKDIFINDIHKSPYLSYLIFLLVIILGVIFKRDFIKDLFKKKKDHKIRT